MAKMPIGRDVRVKNVPDVPAVLPEQAEILNSRAASNLVTVMGFDNKDVLFSSDQVGCVQWRDSEGEIVALLVRLRPDIWGFSRRGDEDWAQVLAQYGNADNK